MSSIINRRELLLFGGAAVAFPTTSQAIIIPPPPPSLWYLIFITNGVYRISNFLTVTLPASAGTCQNYNASNVSVEFGSNFSFTGRSGVSAWNQLTGAPQYKWWEVLDKRNGLYVKLYQYDRIEAKFADGSRVKVVFNGPGAAIRFQPLVGTERLPDGTRLYPREACHCHGDDKPRGSTDTGVISVKPTGMTFSWSWSSQDTPW